MASRVMRGLGERGSHDSPPIPNESRREPQRVPDDCPPPRGLSAAIVASEDLAGRPGPGSSAAALDSGGTRTSPLRPAHPLRRCRLLFTRPLGILFIIFPLHLIKPHSVMNLEISIKHISTERRGPGGGRRLRAPCGGGRAGLSPSAPARSCLQQGLGRGPGPSSPPWRTTRDPCGSSHGLSPWATLSPAYTQLAGSRGPSGVTQGCCLPSQEGGVSCQQGRM